MRALIQFLTENPILLLILVGWLAGLIGKLGQAAKKARERGQPAPSEPSEAQAEADAAEIAREMRRILRQRETETPPSLPSAPPPPRRPVVVTERPPQPVAPTTGSRRLSLHEGPHLGESFGQRAQRQRSRVGEHGVGQEIGNLGGRVHQGAARRGEAHRFALDDLKRAFVLSEILGPPLSLRQDRQV